MAANSNKETNLSDGGKWYENTPTDTDQLLSFEKLDRASPDLWPEQIPGVSEYAADKLPSSRTNSPPKWMADLENDDINLLQEFGSLTTSQLMEKVRGLQNLAYQLGLDEAREMTRGKFLQVLQKPKRN
ncbi:protein lin-52 homolog [Mercenaria mercenaria]|uniref:protein lin-52 homolog n=1 Tax=Mercenaria mercenaria TaxID=6596 RepID=UPI001E1D2B2C|nr:protein lin-52 homolog [Mercenaria mercenaria]